MVEIWVKFVFGKAIRTDFDRFFYSQGKSLKEKSPQHKFELFGEKNKAINSF